MFKSVYLLFSSDPSEGRRIFLMIFMGFFIGIFLATFTVASQTMFLQEFDANKDLPVGIILSGVFGLFAAYLFNLFQGRIAYHKLAILFTLAIFITLSGLTLSYFYLSQVKIVIFLSFAFIGPFAAISLLIFWGTFGRLFNLREAKKIIGNIDSGTLIASLLSFFSIPFVLKLLESTPQLYLISASAFFVAFLTLVFISISYNIGKSVIQDPSVKITRYSYRKLFQDRYTLLMSVFVVLSVISFAFVDYSFLNATSQQFPEEQDLAGFLSYFEGSVVIFSFLFQTFITDRIISNYGLKVALLINPILLGLLTAASITVGSLFGFTSAATNFILFFLMISMSKLFLAALKDALDGPTFKLYFLPISPNVKFDVQTKIEGVVNVFAGLIAGSLILLISNVAVFNLLTVVIFVLPLAALWYFITQKMHSRYKDTLKHTLETSKQKKDVQENTVISSGQILSRELSSGNSQNAFFALKILQKMDPSLYHRSINSLTHHENQELREFASNEIRLSEDSDDPKAVIEARDDRSEIKKLALMALETTESGETLDFDQKQLTRISKSPDVKERIFLAKWLGRMLNEENTYILLELLRDVNPQVKMAAIETARIKKVEDSWPYLVELLGSVTYSSQAMSALIEMGQPVLGYLEKAFHRSDQSEEVMKKIVRIYDRIGGEQAMELLWLKIDFPDKEILSLVLNSMLNNRYKIPGENRIRIKNLLESAIGITLWNLAAKEELPQKLSHEMLDQAITEEIQNNFDRIYLLLALLYDPDSIDLVRKNVESGTTEGITFALELLDIFVEPDVKRILFPILDDISVAEKLRMLQDDFPREKFNELDLLKHILNRDYNQVNRWTKACALYSLRQIPDLQVSDSMIAHLFNPDRLLRETAAWLIYSVDPGIYEKISRRLRPDIKKGMDDLLKYSSFSREVTPEMDFSMERIMFLLSIDFFKGIPGELITIMADHLKREHYDSGDYLFHRLPEWNGDLLMVKSGKVMLEGGDDLYKEMTEGNVFGEFLVPRLKSDNLHAFVLEKTEILKLDKGRLFDLMGKYDKITRWFIHNWEKQNLKIGTLAG